MSAILCHTNISEVVSKYPPKPVQNLTLTPGKFLVSLTWEDPVDYTEEGYTCTWAKTVVVRKQGGYPNDIHDGVVVVTTVERDKYKKSGYEDSGLTGGETYYYKIFTCNTDGVYSEPAEGSAVPIQYRVMTVKINLSNSNPATCGSYADDASSMSFGKGAKAVSDWQDFFQYKPCLFKDGKVVGYLNPNNFNKFENGTTADIESGESGDVMIQFPRRGLKISKSGKMLFVSMTDHPNDPNFKYYAHQRGNTNKDYFYLGAYQGCFKGSYFRSLAFGDIKADTYTSMSDMYKWANAQGNGYGIMSLYQVIYVQAMYILQFRGNLNSQSVLGFGGSQLDGHHLSPGSGGKTTAGMLHGDNYNDAILFGLDDFYGNYNQYINCCYTDNTCAIYATTDDRLPSDKYTKIGQCEFTSYAGGFLTDCAGTSELGFIGTTRSSYNSGSASTYFCDFGAVNPNSTMLFGGPTGGNQHNGVFLMQFSAYRDNSNDEASARLQYL